MSTFSLMGLADAMAATKNRYGLQLSSHRLAEIKKRVLELVTSSRFQKLLEGATVSVEQSLSFNDELKQVDLLLEYENRCLVIDYKSSKKYQLKHVAQVGLYKRAIESIKKKPTQGVLVYLLDEGTEFVGV
jgi:exodeoxyribonuclease V beta subunit